MKYLYALLLLLPLASCSEPDVPSDSFDFFWKEMDRKYVFFNEKGVDWNSVYATYKPQLANGSKEDYLRVFSEIIQSLKDGHVSVMMEDTTIAYQSYINEYDREWIDLSRYGAVQLSNENNSSYAIYQLDNSIIYIASYSFSVPFRLDEFKRDLRQCRMYKGVIVDIRTNGGGNTLALMQLASCFTHGQQTVAYEKQKTGSGHNDFSNFLPVTLSGQNIIDEKTPIVVLTGSVTYSAANMFAFIMKQQSNVVLVGTKTGGGGAAITIVALPNGWMLGYSAAVIFDVNHNLVEDGIEPTFHVEMTAADIEYNRTAGIHKQMEFAYRYLNK